MPSPFIKEIDAKYISGTGDSTTNNWTDTYSHRQSTRLGNLPTTPNRQSYTQPPSHYRPISKTISLRPTQENNPTGESIKAGSVIEHERFGIGEVMKVEGVGDNCKATVKFRNAGEKQLLLKFARFKVIG